MRGSAVEHDARHRDPFFRAISELREQVDRLIDEQKATLGDFLIGIEQEPPAPARPSVAAGLVETTPLTSSAPLGEPVARPRRVPASAAASIERREEPAAPRVTAAEPVSRAKRPAPSVAFDRRDEPSATPPRPASVPTPAPEAPAAARSDDPRERLDALAKRLDRKLRQSATTGTETAE